MKGKLLRINQSQCQIFPAPWALYRDYQPLLIGAPFQQLGFCEEALVITTINNDQSCGKLYIENINSILKHSAYIMSVDG